jgi:hypothetical protein
VADAFSTYINDQILTWLKGTNFVAAAATTYVALYTSDPTDADVGVEVTGGSYARVAITNATGWSAISTSGGGRVVSNAANVTFAAPTANWGTVTHVGLRSALTAGNLWWYGPLNSPVTINNGDPAFYFPANQLIIGAGD